MYSVTYTLVRPNTEVPFMNPDPQSPVCLKNEEFLRLRAAAPGFVGVSRTRSPDDLTLVSISQWESKETHDTFMTENRELVTLRKTLRSAYYADTGIVSTVSKG